MHEEQQQFISAIHHSGRRAVIAVTGGGSLAVSDLLCVPGASEFLLEAVVPYAPRSMTDWLKREPEQFCSRETALAMAVVAWQRAQQLSADPANAIGVGCTASLVSKRTKRGDHRAWVAIQTSRATRLTALTLSKGSRDRIGEERLVADVFLQRLGESCGETSPAEIILKEGDALSTEECDAHPLLVDLVLGRLSSLWAIPKLDLSPPAVGWCAEPPLKPAGLLAGSFNPFHEGHRELAQLAEQALGGPVAFELTWINVDKPPLDFLTIETRCHQFKDRPIVLTQAPTFLLKSRLFPNTTFVVGIDTAERIVQPKYYHDSDSEMLAALSEIRSHGCRFLVAGRLSDNTFRTLSSLRLPAELHDLFEEIPEAAFRCDVSSTELRVKAQHEATQQDSPR